MVYSVNDSVLASYTPIAARGSIAFGINRLFVMSSCVTCAARANAASVAALSPSSH